jgi:dTDP-4-dehydrorhamnose 3,5-epimerase
MGFETGPIEGVVVMPLRRFEDERGWLAELYRTDELPGWCRPAMAYASRTNPGVLRGPHEHVDQADLSSFIGPGDFKVMLWDNRPDSPSYRHRMEMLLGSTNPATVLIPKGVVHCYRCVSAEAGWIFNAPDRLFAGEGRAFPVDEIRHEDDPGNPFVQDERTRRTSL